MPVHYIAEIHKAEGTYRARLYTRLKRWKYDVSQSLVYRQGVRLATDMRHHIDNIPNWDHPTVITGDLVKEEGLSAIASKLDNELEQGIIVTDNFTLTLEPDPVLHDLIDAMRDRDQEVWLELTLEQTPDFAKLNAPNKIIWESRKTRLVYWGRLIRNEAKGKVERQNFPNPLIKEADAELHLGEMAFGFQSWFNIVCAQPVARPENTADTNFFLDAYISKYDPALQDWVLPVSDLFYNLFTWISPSSLVAFADDRLHTESDYPIASDDSKNIDRCNFRHHYKIVGPQPTFTPVAEDLWHLRIEVAKGGVYRPLFGVWSGGTPFAGGTHNKEKDSEVSLYKKWNTVGDACKMLAREFRYKFQYTLPTLADLRYFAQHHARYNENLSMNRTRYWDSTVRWLFTEARYMPLHFPLGYMTVKEKTVEYTPAAVFTNKIDIKETSFAYDNTTSQWSGIVDESPTPGHSSSNEEQTSPDESAEEAGLEISYELLFALGSGQLIKAHDWRAGSLTYNTDILWFLDGGNVLLIHDDVSGLDIPSDSVISEPALYHSWAQFHFFKEEQEWWSPRALLEFEIEGVGTMNFPTFNNFGLLDFGEFTHLRKFDASPGILYNKKDGKPILGIFSVFDISQQPGGDTKIRAIEINTEIPVALPDITPVLKTRRITIDPPPPFLGSPICGQNTIVFCIGYPEGCIDHANVFLDGVLIDVVTQVPNFPNPMPQDCVPLKENIDTTKLANGAHTICIDLYPCGWTTPIHTCWTFNVQNPCGPGTNPNKYWSP